MSKYAIGLVFKSKNFGEFEIIEKLDRQHAIVKFLDTGYETKTQYSQILKGTVKDPMFPSVCGVGYTGEIGFFKAKTKEYKLWQGMLMRCYDHKYRSNNKSYEGCTVSEEFKNFSNFYSWVNLQKGFNKKGWQIDKDLLSNGNKIYSEETCIFLPSVINCAITKGERKLSKTCVGVSFNNRTGKYEVRLSRFGKLERFGNFYTENDAFFEYKKQKQQYLKCLAEKFKQDLDVRAYTALMNYEITKY